MGTDGPSVPCSMEPQHVRERGREKERERERERERETEAVRSDAL